jgi:hypothetical protein
MNWRAYPLISSRWKLVAQDLRSLAVRVDRDLARCVPFMTRKLGRLRTGKRVSWESSILWRARRR